MTQPRYDTGFWGAACVAIFAALCAAMVLLAIGSLVYFVGVWLWHLIGGAT